MEDIKKMFQRREEIRLRNQSLQSEYNRGLLKCITPHFHVQPSKMDFSKLKDGSTYYDEGVEVLSIDFDILMSLDFMIGVLRNKSSREEIKKTWFTENQTWDVFEFWKKGEPLIPPSIFWNDYNDETQFLDGRHRLVVACYLGITKTPIICPKSHISKIKKLHPEFTQVK